MSSSRELSTTSKQTLDNSLETFKRTMKRQGSSAKKGLQKAGRSVSKRLGFAKKSDVSTPVSDGPVDVWIKNSSGKKPYYVNQKSGAIVQSRPVGQNVRVFKGEDLEKIPQNVTEKKELKAELNKVRAGSEDDLGPDKIGNAVILKQLRDSTLNVDKLVASNITCIDELLEAVELKEYIPIFKEEGIDLPALMLLKREHLDDMGMKMGDRIKLQRIIEGIRKVPVGTRSSKIDENKFHSGLRDMEDDEQTDLEDATPLKATVYASESDENSEGSENPDQDTDAADASDDIDFSDKEDKINSDEETEVRNLKSEKSRAHQDEKTESDPSSDEEDDPKVSKALTNKSKSDSSSDENDSISDQDVDETRILKSGKTSTHHDDMESSASSSDENDSISDPEEIKTRNLKSEKAVTKIINTDDSSSENKSKRNVSKTFANKIGSDSSVENDENASGEDIEEISILNSEKASGRHEEMGSDSFYIVDDNVSDKDTDETRDLKSAPTSTKNSDESDSSSEEENDKPNKTSDCDYTSNTKQKSKLQVITINDDMGNSESEEQSIEKSVVSSDLNEKFEEKPWDGSASGVQKVVLKVNGDSVEDADSDTDGETGDSSDCSDEFEYETDEEDEVTDDEDALIATMSQGDLMQQLAYEATQKRLRCSQPKSKGILPNVEVFNEAGADIAIRNTHLIENENIPNYSLLALPEYGGVRPSEMSLYQDGFYDESNNGKHFTIKCIMSELDTLCHQLQHRQWRAEINERQEGQLDNAHASRISSTTSSMQPTASALPIASEDERELELEIEESEDKIVEGSKVKTVKSSDEYPDDSHVHAKATKSFYEISCALQELKESQR